MPLWGKKAFVLSSKVRAKCSSQGSYVIEHTGEKFDDKLKHEQVLELYNRRIWTCQCTGKTNMTHEEAVKSEKLERQRLSRNFPQHLEKPVLQMLHHDTRSLESIVDSVKEMLGNTILVGDRVTFHVTNAGKAIWGTVILRELAKVMCPIQILGEAKKNVNNRNVGTASKSNPKASCKYSIRLTEDSQIINSVPAEDLLILGDRPAKSVLKQFVRSSAMRCGTHSNSPWVVNEELVKKYSLPSKLVDLLIPAYTVTEDGSEFRKRKAESSDGQVTKMSKLTRCTPKIPKALEPKKSDNGMRKQILDVDSESEIEVVDSKQTDEKGKASRTESPKQEKLRDGSQGKGRESVEPVGKGLSGETSEIDGINTGASRANTEKKQPEVESTSTIPGSSDSTAEVEILQGSVRGEEKAGVTTPKSCRRSPPLLKTPTASPESGFPRTGQRTPRSEVKIVLEDVLKRVSGVSPRGKVTVTSSDKDRRKKSGLAELAARCAGSKFPVVRLEDCMLALKRSSHLKAWTFSMKAPKKTVESVKRNIAKELAEDVEIVSVEKGKGEPSPRKVLDSRTVVKETVKNGSLLLDILADDTEKDSGIGRTEGSPVRINVSEGHQVKTAAETGPVNKTMRQMTLYDMKLKPSSIGPRKDTPLEKSNVLRRVFLTSLDLDMAINAIQLNKTTASFHRNQLATLLSTEEIEALPSDVQNAVLASKLRLERKNMLSTMTEAERRKDLLDMRRKARKRRGFLPTKEDLIDDQCVMDARPLPVPTMVNTPDNIPNELFGDVAMTVEFFNIYKEILMPEKVYPVTADFMLTALGLGNGGFRYVSNILLIALNVLIQDGITQGYKELGVPLLDLQLDVNVAAEMTRICLQRTNDSTEPHEEVPSEVLALLESSEMHEIDPRFQMQIIAGLCNLVLRTHAIQEYMDNRQKYTKECWRNQIDIWIKNKEAKANVAIGNGKEEPQEPSRVLESVASEGQDGSEDKNLCVQNRRQVLAQKALLPEKNEVAKVEPPKSLMDEIAESKSATRVTCLGVDRNYSRYWVFPGCLNGLYVERGWASNCEVTEDGDGDGAKDGPSERVPTPGQNLWFLYKSAEEVDQLLKTLDSRGCRENRLLKHLKQRHKEIIRCLSKRKFRGLEFVESDGKNELIASLRNKLENMESDLRKGCLGRIPKLEKWEKKLREADSCETLGECLIELQESIFPGFYIPPDSKYLQNGIGGGSRSANEVFRQIVLSCNTLSRLHLLVGVLYVQIKWDRSMKNVKCTICRKKEGRAMVVCVDCSRAYHVACLRPMLQSVPEAGWQCAACAPKVEKRKKVYHEESDDSSKEIDELENQALECVICNDGNDDIVTCSKCNSDYHTDCHVPNLRHLPRGGNWVCEFCRQGKSTRARRKIIEELQNEMKRKKARGRTLRSKRRK